MDTASVAREATAGSAGGVRRAVDPKVLQVNVHAVSESDQLENTSNASHSHQGAPEVGHGVGVVYVASTAKPEADTGESHGDREEDSRNAPTNDLRDVEELATRDNVPADLKVHRQSTNANPHGGAQSASHDEGTAPRASHRRVHIVWCNRVVALLRIRAQGYCEAKADHDDCNDQTH